MPEMLLFAVIQHPVELDGIPNLATVQATVEGVPIGHPHWGDGEGGVLEWQSESKSESLES